MSHQPRVKQEDAPKVEEITGLPEGLTEAQGEDLKLADEFRSLYLMLQGQGLNGAMSVAADTDEYVQNGQTKTNIILLMNGSDLRIGKSGMTWDGIEGISRCLVWAACNPLEALDWAHRTQRAFQQHAGRTNGTGPSRRQRV